MRDTGSAHVPGSRAEDVESVILGLAAQEATGCLTIADAAGDEGLVWFRDGQVYAVSVPGPRPLLGVRLVTAGAISPEQLTEALHVQRTDMPSSRLGEVLVTMGLVNRRVVEGFALEQQRDMLAELLAWPIHTTWFRNGAHTRTDLAPFTDVPHLIEHARLRQAQWPEVVEDLGGRDVVPMLSGAAAHTDLSPSEAVVLQSVDGVRSLADIADACGYTLFEAADLVRGLMAAGLVTTARDLLDESTWQAPSSPEPDGEPLAEVLELHPTSPRVHGDEPARHEHTHDTISTPISRPIQPAEPAQTPTEVPEQTPVEAPAASGYATLPPPSAAPLGQPLGAPLPPPEAASLDRETASASEPPAEPAPAARAVPVEPPDTAALLRELTGLGDLDGR